MIKKLISNKPAHGVSGILCKYANMSGYFLRVTDPETFEFIDYDLTNHDLSITIDDEFAHFYEYDDGTAILDYSPTVLGK